MGTDPLARAIYGLVTRLAEAFCAWCYFGFLSVVIDIDHLPWILTQMFPGVYSNLAKFWPRFSHKAVYHGLFIILLILVTYVSGRLIVLNNKLRRK